MYKFVLPEGDVYDAKDWEILCWYERENFLPIKQYISKVVVLGDNLPDQMLGAVEVNGSLLSTQRKYVRVHGFAGGAVYVAVIDHAADNASADLPARGVMI